MSLKAIEWVGSITGLVGAGLLATNSPLSGYGFVAFLASNLCWFIFGYKTRAYGLLVMQVGFTLTSILGIWRWLI
ncbi:nicotinamide mononucleotide transporter [Azonexus hydrophilus]|uniref:Nicotinamide mononucleotide transporter n=1 Tax=Azonexus hydrophilus TaxID=418702 RepID=A0ABZ2XL69_9RHOO